MKMLSLPLVAATGLLAAPLLCCAASATTSLAPTTIHESETNAQKGDSAADKTLTPQSGLDAKSKADFDSDEDDFDDEESDDEEDLDEEQMSAPYPFGELKLEAPSLGSITAPSASTTTPKSDVPGQLSPSELGKPLTPAAPSALSKPEAVWKAQLPAKSFVINSQWAEKPEFQNAARPDGKPQGAATLALQQISDTETQPFSLYVLMYIYDPEAVGIAMTSPEKVIEQLITTPAEEAKQYGFTSTINELPSTQPLDARVMQERGILKDVRKKVDIGQQGKILYYQFYRLFIGKDFVVLGLVLGGEDGLEKKAQNFFDTISLSPLPAGSAAPTLPGAPVVPGAPVTPGAPVVPNTSGNTPAVFNTAPAVAPVSAPQPAKPAAW